MLKKTNDFTGSNRVLYSLLAAWQVIDVALHISIDEMEPVRVMASILLVLAATTAERLGEMRRPVFGGTAAAYLGLNAIFLAQNGLIHPETETVRTPLFVFVGVSLVLFGLLFRSLKT